MSRCAAIAAAALVVLLAPVTVSGGAAGSVGKEGLAKPRTLLTIRRQIRSFAQEGRSVAFVTRGGRCGGQVHVVDLVSRRDVVVNRGRADPCAWANGFFGIALAGKRALWKEFTGFGNTEADLTVLTGSTTDGRARVVQEMMMERDPANGIEAPDPPLAGAGRGLVYYEHEDGVGGNGTARHNVRRIVGHRSVRLFGAERPVSLALSRGRIAAVERRLRRGDGCGCNFAPTWSPDGTKIGFLVGDASSDDLVPAEIYTMGADGSGRKRLTSDGRQRESLDWSPDGTSFAYTYWSPSFVRTLAVSKLDGSDARDLGAGADPRWSPDGTKLAFERSTHIFVVNADGTGARDLGSGNGPAWSPDGAKLAFARDFALYVMNADGSGARQVAPRHEIERPAWSPDGQRIAFLDFGDIFVIGTDGSSRTRLARFGAGAGAPDWSPDGRRIAFASLRNDLVADGRTEYEIYTMNADGTDQRALTFTKPNAWTSRVQVRTLKGSLVSRFSSEGAPGAVALSDSLAAVVTRVHATNVNQIELFNARTGASHGIAPVPHDTNAVLAASGPWVVFETGKAIRLLDVRTRKTSLLAIARGDPIGLSVSGRRVAWAENVRGRGRVRAVLLPAA